MFSAIISKTDFFCHEIHNPLPSDLVPDFYWISNFFSHLLDHSPLNRGIGKCNYSNLVRDQLVLVTIPPVSYLEVEVDVHDAVALPITALVVELSYVIVALLPKDHEAWGVGHAFSIS